MCVCVSGVLVLFGFFICSFRYFVCVCMYVSVLFYCLLLYLCLIFYTFLTMLPTSSPITTPSLIIILPVENPHPLHLTAFVFLPSIAVKPEVIDYGHGAKTDDPIADLDREADRFERDRASRLDRPKWDDSRHLKSQ